MLEIRQLRRCGGWETLVFWNGALCRRQEMTPQQWLELTGQHPFTASIQRLVNAESAILRGKRGSNERAKDAGVGVQGNGNPYV